MIELIVYPKGKNAKLINPSPFCSKAEIFLTMAKIEHNVVEFNGNPAKFPNKKLPVLQHNSQTVPDSSLIQKHLAHELKIDMDSHLSPAENAQGFAFSKMFEEYFYWSLLHERWFIDENWQKLKGDYFGHIPGLLRGVVTNMIRKSTLKSALGHGVSRHSDDQVLDFGKDCLRPSSYDVTSYAFVSNILHSDLGPVLRTEAEKFDNLKAYDERMYTRVFG